LMARSSPRSPPRPTGPEKRKCSGSDGHWNTRGDTRWLRWLLFQCPVNRLC